MYKRKLIMVIDDDTKMLKLLQQMLHGEQYIVITKLNAESVIQVIDSVTVDLFIVDIMMPIVNGIELCKTLREKIPHDTPILMLSARDDKKTKDLANLAGASCFLSKKAMHKNLSSKVSNLIKGQFCYH